uniref:G_PROTEIN_RECEP_F1_2 domain-containing protein n=1 Tax=Heterorhabditis bacteriophora TaxID=37862 RepID=A0A1I7WRA1_HETBA
MALCQLVAQQLMISQLYRTIHSLLNLKKIKTFATYSYGPHMTAIVLLCLIIITLFPTGFAMMTLYQHEDKPLLITCLIVDVVYVFLWIIYWLILTMKRDWSFNIVHRTHQFYALQKGMASGHIKGNENPSQLKNALIVMHKDHNNIKNTPEMSRLIRRTSDDNSQSTAYNSVTRSSHIQPPPTHSAPLTMRGNSSPSEDREQNTFGTLQRSQQATYMSTLQRSHPGNTTLHRSIPLGQWATPQEAYASIHKAKEHNVYQRGSNEVPNYGQSETTYSSYGTYARLPQQSRIPVQPGQQHTVLRINNSNYGLQQQNTLRDLAPSQWSSQRNQSGQSSQALWNQNKHSKKKVAAILFSICLYRSFNSTFSWIKSYQHLRFLERRILNLIITPS